MTTDTRDGAVAAIGSTARPLAVHVLAVSLFMILPTAVIAHKALTILAVIAACASLDLLRQRQFTWRLLPRVYVNAFTIFLLWATFSAAWSGDPERSIRQAIELIAIVGGGFVLIGGLPRLNPSEVRYIGTMAAWGAALGLALFAIDIGSNQAIRRLLFDEPARYGRAILNPAATVAALIIWPVCYYLLQRSWLIAIAALAVCVGLLVVAESGSALTGLFTGTLTMILITIAPYIMTRVLAISQCLMTLFAPVLITFLSGRMLAQPDHATWPSTGVHRLYIWQFTGEKIYERPLTGWGLDSARAIPGGGQRLVDVNPGLPAETYGGMTVMPLHPHNAGLQIWLELGLPGAMTLAALTVALLFSVPRVGPDRLGKGAVAATLIAGLTLCSLSYGVWQAWWLCALWLGVALVRITMASSTDA